MRNIWSSDLKSLFCVVQSCGDKFTATHHISAEFSAEHFFTLSKNFKQLILCYPENHEK